MAIVSASGAVPANSFFDFTMWMHPKSLYAVMLIACASKVITLG